MTAHMTPARQVRKIDNLVKAWAKVQENGRSSQSADTRREIKAFSEDAYATLRSIQNRLSRKKFEFKPARGAPIHRGAGKRSRPIVIAPIESRIVQRGILDVIQSVDEINTWTNNPYSFGGLPKGDGANVASVPAAIAAAVNAICSGGSYYIRSDIADFFTKIPKAQIVSQIASVISDTEFLDLLEQAINLELSNLNELRRDVDLFPLEDVGVAQGCALSPLMGNIMLSEFDIAMNSGSCTCLRYIDDFLIIGPNKKEVWNTFRTGVEILTPFDMAVYDPRKQPEKASQGDTGGKLEFLGVELRPGIVRPSKKSRKRLLANVSEVLEKGWKAFPNVATDEWDYKRSLMGTLRTVDGIVGGWGNQYFYCNQEQILGDLDEKIDHLLGVYIGRYTDHRKKVDRHESRRLLGVRNLTDCRRDPLTWGPATG